jgi:hypothetical protein
MGHLKQTSWTLRRHDPAAAGVAPLSTANPMTSLHRVYRWPSTTKKSVRQRMRLHIWQPVVSYSEKALCRARHADYTHMICAETAAKNGRPAARNFCSLPRGCRQPRRDASDKLFIFRRFPDVIRITMPLSGLHADFKRTSRRNACAVAHRERLHAVLDRDRH